MEIKIKIKINHYWEHALTSHVLNFLLIILVYACDVLNFYLFILFILFFKVSNDEEMEIGECCH